MLAWPETPGGVVAPERIVDLGARMDGSGRLQWDVPAGKWVIQRIGHVSTGSSTRPPVLGGNGLECDRLNKEAMDVQFAGMMQKLIAGAGPLAGSALAATHIDSWESGSQNWTALLPAEFQKRRGYDLMPFLPDITAKLQIGGRALADRFRWDFYQTISELLAENYTGRIAALAHRSGLRFTLEGYELPFGDEQNYTAPADEPMTEFWTPSRWGRRLTESKAHQMASVAHVYGRPVVGAEAFTSDDKEQWLRYPATVKALGDFEFSKGVSRFVFHRYAHQPYLNRFPGTTMGPWGLHYERTNTWWDMSLPWHQYLARSQYMLRQGVFVADLLYARPEFPNQDFFNAAPPPPPGYNYDEATAQAIIERASVKDGRIVLPDGMSYRLLVLSPLATSMTPAFLHKLRDLIAAGASVSGAPPKTSPSLTDYPKCNEEIASLSKEIWADCDGKTVTRHAYGKGAVYWGKPLPELLSKLDTPPDFTSDTKLNWIHRRAGATEIYFVANPAGNAVSAQCTFRAPGMRAERWDAESGGCSALAATSGTTAGTLAAPLRLDPSGSAFVVFRPADSVPANLTAPLGETKPLAELTGPWDIHFPPRWGAPPAATFESLISWSDSPDPGVKYFSGTATYEKTFTADVAWFQPRARLALDLGNVEVMARVRLNGKDMGILWKPPYRVEITGAIKAGENKLEIDVVNLWPNRMIGDAALPAEKRFTWSSWEPFNKDSPLLKSGLLGPVEIEGGR